MLRTRILAAATATLLALGMAAGGASAATAAPQEDTKVWVCKYSGTPGVNEQYKDGKNPIEVSVTTIANNSGFDPVTGTGYFADGQARSFSLGYSDTFDAPPTIEDCPRPVLPIPGYDVTDETCEAGGSITLDESEWITYVVTNSSGVVIPNDQLTNLAPGTYTVTPTAVPPAILDMEGYDPAAVIDAVDPVLCAEEATASIAFTAATCLTGQQLNADGFAASGATLTSSTVVDGVYTVVFTADSGYLFADGDGVSEDRTTLTFTGTLGGVDLTKCAVATASIAFSAPTCTTGEQLNEGGYQMSGATLTSSGVVDGVYTVVFTATPGSLFAAGENVSLDRTTLTYTGSLDPPDLTLCPVATAAIDFTAPTCNDAEMLNEGGFGGDNSSYVIVDDGSEDGTYEVVFTADGDALFAAGPGVSEDRTTLTFTGTLDPKDERLCQVVTASFTLPPATCEVGEDWANPIVVADAGVVWGDPEYDAEAGTVSIEFLATGATVFVVEVAGEPTFVKTLTVTLDVADRDPLLCLEATGDVPINPATCELGESLDELGIDAVGATFIVMDDGSESGSYEVVFTAEEGYRFAGDQLTLTVSGDLADRDPELCLEATGTVPIIDPTCELDASVDEENISAVNATWEVIDDGSTDGSYEVLFTANDGYRFTGDQKTLTVSGELAPNDERLCLVVEASFTLPPATCEVGEDWENPIIVADAGVTYGEPEFDPETQTVSITFLATGANIFVVDVEGELSFSKTLTVTLDVADRDPELCLEPTYEVPLIDATCELGESLDVEGIDAENASWVVVDDGSESGTYEVVFTADAGYRFPGDEQTLTVSDELADRNPLLCEEASGSVPLIDPTCELGASVDVENISAVNATWEVIDNGSESGSYEVEFTALEGFRFAGDQTTLTVSGELADRDPELCLEPTYEVPLIDATCELGESLDVEGIDAENATWVVVDDGSESGTYEVEFTADEGYRFADDQLTLTVSGDLADRDPLLCEEASGSVPLIDPTCELGASVDLENISGVNATWEVIDDGSESGSYEVEFTALEGFRFAGDQTTLMVSGDLADRNPELCLEPTYVAPLIDATCELGESLDVEGIDAENATWVVVDDGSESGTYEIEFTADEGYRFAGDQQTLTVTGELAGPNTELCLEAVAAIAVTDADCFFDSMLDEEGFTAENATYEITVYNAETREYEVVFTAAYGYRFDTSLDGVSEDGTTRTFSGTLEAADPNGDGCVLPITDASIAFIDATCLDPQSLDEENFVFDSELAALDSVMYDGLDYEVVFVTIGEDTKFFQTDEPVEGRTVSEDGTVLTFTGTLDGPNEELCPEVIVPPIVVVDDCFEQSYTITDVEGVTYTRTVNGLELPVSFGEGDSVTYEAAPFDTITVTATPDEGYLLDEGYEPFEYTYAFDEDCLPTAPVTTASVTWTQADCLGNPGSYTLTNEPGVIWTVDGVVVEGNTKYTAAIGSTPSIVASLEPASEEFPTGFGWSDEDQRTLWNLVFAAAEDCLPTLAITGASNALGGLGVIAILIMMAGTGLVVARRREAVRIQG